MFVHMLPTLVALFAIPAGMNPSRYESQSLMTQTTTLCWLIIAQKMALPCIALRRLMSIYISTTPSPSSYFGITVDSRLAWKPCVVLFTLHHTLVDRCPSVHMLLS